MKNAWEEDAAREIELLVRSRYPLIVVDTVEEDRLRELLGRTAFRLDPGTLYDKYVGETEKNLRQALQTVDAMAPVVLWIDEIFFVDLPSAEDRGQILSMYLEKRKRDPTDFDLESLVAASDGFSGAELEQAIVAGLYTAWSGERQLDTEILLGEIETAVPLSRTMAERVGELREWARDRVVPAA